MWARGETYKMVDEESRRIEEVKAENDAVVVPLLLGISLRNNEKT